MLKVQNVEIHVPHRTLVHQLNFELVPGRLMVLLGPNGSGKSTWMRTLAGLSPHLQGEMTWCGQAIHLWNDLERAQVMGWWKREERLSVDVPVYDYVALGRLPWTQWWQSILGGGQEAQKVEAALLEAGVLGLKNQMLGNLSDGERQLVQFARLLVQGSKLWLADEPAAHLDFVQRRRMHQSLRNLCEKLQITMILITHEIDLALEYAHDVLVFRGQGEWKFGSVESMEWHQLIREWFPIDVLSNQMEST
jgi:iron complex transport system ATP-binding protein